MAKVKQEYVLEVTAKGLKEVVKEIRALRADLSTANKSAGGVADGLSKSGKAAGDAASGYSKASKSAGEYDRNAKGAAHATNNGTKAFSKMSQGMSGSLVPAYATVAANVFALTAAFGALERAADIQILIDASDALATQTGRSLSSVAKSMKEITGGALSMKEGLTQASLAASAGFDNSTIEQLTQVARNASVALGRDLTDSMNRVFKGAIKAEPELLDELGIILRLEPATRKYAATLGKSAKDLTTFEKQQAIVNAVLEQGEDKFGKLSEVDVNPYTKLAATFNDLTATLLKFINIGLEPIINFFATNELALTGAFAVFANTVIKAALPAITSFGEQAEEKINNVIKSVKNSLKTSNIAADFATAFNSDEIRNTSEAFEAMTKSMDTAFSEIKLPKGLKKEIKAIWRVSPQDATENQKYKEILKAIEREEAKLAKTTNKTTEVYKQRVQALETLKGAAKTFPIYEKYANNELANTVTIGQRVIAVLHGIRGGFETVKNSIAAGFGKGLQGGILDLWKNTKLFSQSLDTVSARGKVAGVTLKTLSVGAFAVSGAIGGAVKAIPYIGQLIFLFGILKSAFMLVLDLFKDTSSINAYNNAIDDLATTTKETVTTSKYYRNNIEQLAPTLDNVNKKLSHQVNVLTQLRDANKKLADSQTTNSFWLFDLYNNLGDIVSQTTGGAINFGSIANLREALGQEIETLKNEGFGEDIANILFGVDLETAGKAQLNMLSKNLQPYLDKLTEGSQKAADENNKLIKTFTELDSSLTKVSGSLPALTEMEKTFLSLDNIIGSINSGNLLQISQGLTNLSDEQAFMLGFSNQKKELDGLVDSLTSYGDQTTKLSSTMSDYLSSIGDMDAGLKNLVDGYNNGTVSLNTLTYMTRNYALTTKDLSEEQLALLRTIPGLAQAMEIISQATKEANERMKELMETITERLREASKTFKDITNAVRTFAIEANKVKLDNLLLYDNPEKDLQNILKLRELEVKKIQTTISLQNKQYNQIKDDASETLRAEQLKKGILEETAKIFEADYKTLDGINKLLSENVKREALGLSTRISSAKLLENSNYIINELVKSGKLNTLQAENFKNEYIQAYNTLKLIETTRAASRTSADKTIGENKDLGILIDSYALETRYLKENGSLIDDRIDKSLLLSEAAAKESLFQTEIGIDLALQKEDQTSLIKLTEDKLALEEKLDLLQKAKAASLQKEFEISSFKNQIEIKGLEKKLSYGLRVGQLQENEIALEKERIRLTAQGYEKGSEKYEELLKDFKKIQNLNIKSNINSQLSSAIESATTFSDIISELNDNLSSLGENDGIYKLNAGLLAISKIAAQSNDDIAKSFSQLSIIISDFSQQTRKYQEDIKEGGEAAENAVKPDNILLASSAMGALAGAFDEGSDAAKGLKVAQMALASVSAVQAVLAQGEGDPYSAFARMAAMASVVASILSTIGVAFSGGGSSSGTTAADYKASTFGTNDIQGYDTRDNTLGEGLQGLIDINTKLFSAEQDLQIAIKNLSKSFDIVGAQLFKAGGSFDVGSIAQKFGLTFGTKLDPGFLGAFDETVTKDLLAGGVQLGVAIEEVAGSLVGSIKNARLFITQQITEVDSGFFGIGGGTDVDIVTVFRGISEELESSLNKSLNASLNVLVGLVDNFGLDVEETFKDLQLNIPTTQINLEGKSAEEQSALIGKFLTGVVNDVIQESVPWVAKYTQANEDLLATLARLVEQTIIINDAFSIFGQTIDSIASISLTANLSAYETEVIQPFEEESANLANALEQAQEALSFTLTRASNNTTWWGNVIAQLEDRFVDFNEVYAYFEQVSQAGGEGGLGGNISDEAGLIINDYKRYINDLTDTLTNLSVLSFSEWFESVKVAWEEALLGEFGGDQEFFTQTAQKFAKALYSEEELATFAKETATIIVEQGLSTISEQLADTDFSIGAITADVEDIPAFRQLYEDLIDAGVFAGEAGAVLQAAFLKTGAAFGDLIEKVEEFDNAIGNFIRDLERQIAAFGLYGKELDLLQLQFDYEDTLEEARKLGADLALVEELFGLKRIDILRQYNQEIVDNITNTSKAISDAMISVVDSNEAWDYVAYQSLRVEKAADRLKTSLGNLTSDIDFSVFNSDVDTSNFEQLFSSILKFEEDIPTNINDQIALVNQLKDAVLDRYNAEGQAVSNLKDLATDIADFLDSLKLSELSPLTNVERLAEAQRQFTNNLNNLNSDDAEIRAKAQKDLTSSANTYLESAKEYYGISVGFQDVFKNVTSALQATQDSLTSGVGLTPDTLAINVLQQQTLDQLATLDEILYTLEASNAVDYQIEIEAWAAAIGDGSTLNSIEVKLGSLEDAIWATTIANIPEYNTGTSEIEFDQIAKVHKGEMILTPTTSEEVRSGETFITNSTNTTYAGANGESIGTEEIVNAIRILTEVLAVSQEDLLEQGEKMINQASQTKSLNPTPARTSGLV